MLVFLQNWLLCVGLWMCATVKHLTSVTMQVITQTRCRLKSIPCLILIIMRTTLSSVWWLCIERWASSELPASNIAGRFWKHRWYESVQFVHIITSLAWTNCSLLTIFMGHSLRQLVIYEYSIYFSYIIIKRKHILIVFHSECILATIILRQTAHRQ